MTKPLTDAELDRVEHVVPRLNDSFLESEILSLISEAKEARELLGDVLPPLRGLWPPAEFAGAHPRLPRRTGGCVMYRVDFVNVGRDKHTFSAHIKDVCHRELYKCMKGKLCSRGIDFEIDDATRTGFIYVGGFRRVGSFTFAREDSHE